MSGISRRIKKLEAEVGANEDYSPEVLFIVVKDREQISRLRQLPKRMYIEGIEAREKGAKIIAADEYLKKVGNQHPELKPITEGPISAS